MAEEFNINLVLAKIGDDGVGSEVEDDDLKDESDDDDSDDEDEEVGLEE